MSHTLKTTTATVIATGGVLTCMLIYKKHMISNYYNKYWGIHGIFRYIWLGDYLPPPIRKSMDDLDGISQDLNRSESQLENIETLVQRALLESVDGPFTYEIDSENANNCSKQEIQTQIFQQNPGLRKEIGFFSTRLDRLAARIDTVLSHSNDEVKKRKKQLSNKVVALMDALDTTIAMLKKTRY